MSKHHYDHVRANDEFHDLVAQKSKLSWSLAALMMLVYYSFIMIVAFAPTLLGRPISDGSVISWGLPVGIGIILFTFIITGIYVHRANTLYDGLMQKVIDASQVHVDGMSNTDTTTENSSS